MVHPSPQDDVMPPTHVSVSNVSSVGLAGVFVGDLPNELLLCPERALRCYLSWTASIPSRPRSLLFLLVLLLALFRKMLLVSSFRMSLWSPVLRLAFLFLLCPPLRLPPLSLPHPLTLALQCMLMGSGCRVFLGFSP